MVKTLRCVCGAVLSAESADGLFQRVEDHIAQVHEPAPRVALTRMETQIAALVGEGRTNRQIADELGVGIKTVETHLSHVFRKLGIRSRNELRLDQQARCR